MGPRRFDFTREFAVMAIVNRTPDSFFDRGATFVLDAALAHAEAQVAGGADIVDVGGVKAGPGEPVSTAEELDRVLGFVSAFRARSSVPVSIDTYRPEVANAALDAGADLVNDTTGLSDPEIADVVAAHQDAALVIAHHPGPPRSRPWRPDYDPDVVTVATRRLSQLADQAIRRGVPLDQLIVDPGHDLGKTTAQSLHLTREIGQICALGYPVLVAMSNKDFIGEALGLEGAVAQSDDEGVLELGPPDGQGGTSQEVGDAGAGGRAGGLGTTRRRRHGPSPRSLHSGTPGQSAPR